MSRIPPVPLAWRNLVHDPVRFALFASGIGFAVVLMGVQLGIMNAMLDGNTRLFRSIDAELVLLNPARPALVFADTFSRRRLEQAAGVPGVASVHAIYVEHNASTLRHTSADPAGRTQTRKLRVVGVDPAARVFDLPNLDPGGWEALNRPGTTLFDRLSRRNADAPVETVFGPFAVGTHTELAGQNLELAAGFDLGFDFATDGTLILNDRTFTRTLREPYFPQSPQAGVDYAAVRVGPGADPLAVQDRIRAAFAAAADVTVLTKDELVARERGFWWVSTPVGFAFGAGVALGFVVGVVIVYQILSGDVADHLPQYATLKAIGYRNGYLNGIVLQEAGILAITGYLPGLLVTWLAYRLLTHLTGMPLELTPGRAGLVFALTAGMCAASGLLAVRRVKSADPADVFG
ncbi:ABC transporter permease DevC [Urbifossiella limnaea]|uniref:FtsX-like permease family protein n=1 Tax=Urbifossiella limnaea TaxID=2528023 RepID=A0A517XR32_9BACT|nr:ABC transporter permease DevC [Urbifossiella limnaea]QDU19949.1 FtsX-like permease family protein [Urbifossiella limnaea]